jgi:hypothetical protein
MNNDEYPSKLLSHRRFEPQRSYQRCRSTSITHDLLGPLSSRLSTPGVVGCVLRRPSARAAELHDRTVLGFATKMRKTRPPFR